MADKRGSFLTPILESIMKPILEIRGIIFDSHSGVNYDNHSYFFPFIRDRAFEHEQTWSAFMWVGGREGYLKVCGGVVWGGKSTFKARVGRTCHV